LKWGHIDWERSRIIVPSPKMGDRVMPLFPELTVLLDELDQLTPAGTEFVINRYRSAETNLRTQFQRIITRAGLKAWPKLFHNLRATRQTELSYRFPAHVVSSWLGNSVQIATKHYLRTTDEHFAKAVIDSSEAQQNPQDATPAIRSYDAHGEPGNEKTPCFQGVPEQTMGVRGLEPRTSALSELRSSQLSYTP
jgi:hypothetical protein